MSEAGEEGALGVTGDCEGYCDFSVFWEGLLSVFVLGLFRRKGERAFLNLRRNDDGDFLLGLLQAKAA